MAFWADPDRWQCTALLRSAGSAAPCSVLVFPLSKQVLMRIKINEIVVISYLVFARAADPIPSSGKA